MEDDVHIVELRFDNPESDLYSVAIQVDRAACPIIMDWYGAYCAGDDYRVFINGEEIPLGVNGELEGVTIDA